MEVGPVVGFSVGLVVLGCLVPQWLRLWRHEPSLFDKPVLYWIWGEAAWRAARRAAVVGMSLGLPFIAACLDLALTASSRGIVFDVARGVIISLSIAIWLVVIATGVFNRPKLLVPPHLRDEPNLIRDLMGQKRRRQHDRA